MPKWRKNSTFGPGHRVPLDREQRAQFKARLHLQRRPGRITLAAEKIGNIMLGMVGNDGRLDPSHEHLAARAKIATSTVRRALERLRLCGFLDWTRRLVRSKATGWRCEQTSNSYVLRAPACDAHFERPVVLIDSKKEAREQEMVLEAPALGRQGALEGLREVLKRREARLSEAWMARSQMGVAR